MGQVREVNVMSGFDSKAGYSVLHGIDESHKFEGSKQVGSGSKIVVTVS